MANADAPPTDEPVTNADAPPYGWTLLFPDRHPYAGGLENYAGYLTDGSGFEVELCASAARPVPVDG